MTDWNVLMILGFVVWLCFMGAMVVLEWRDYKKQREQQKRMKYRLYYYKERHGGGTENGQSLR